MQITQCPDCHTAFKVSPEHLAVANGWVRCGRCGAVFEALKHNADAQAQMQTEDDESVAQAAAQAAAQATATSPLQTTGLAMPAPANSPALTSKNDIDDFHDSLMNFVPATRTGDVPGNADHSANAANTAMRRTWWWHVLSGVLGLVLALQAVLWHRNLLVAQEPALQGLIEGLCAPFGCEWHWPQTLDAVQIENSSFTENADGTYRLQLRLKNTQHHAVAMPLLELTLTDERDEVVLRRVFQPSELGLKDHLAALRDARSTLNFDLDDNLKPRVVGFRALIFYP